MADSSSSGKPTPNTLKQGVNKPNTLKQGVKINRLSRNLTGNIGSGNTNDEASGRQSGGNIPGGGTLRNIGGAAKNKLEDRVKKEVKRRIATVIVSSAPAWIIPVLIVVVVILVVIIFTAIITVITGQPTTTANNQSTQCSSVTGSLCKPAGTDCTTLTPPMVQDTGGLVCGQGLICCLPPGSGSSSTPPGSGCKASPTNKFYCQWGQSYSSRRFDSGTIASTGCGPTSLAMIMSSYCDTHGPAEIAADFDTNGWSNLPGSGRTGTSFWTFSTQKDNWFKSLGYEDPHVNLKSGSQSINYTQAKSYLSNGYLLFAGAYWPPINGGHSFVVDDVRINSSGGVDIHVRDPNGCTSLSNEFKWYSAYLGGTGWYWLVPVRPIQ